MEEGDSKSACEAKLRKKVTQSNSVLEGSPRSNTEDAIKKKEIPGAIPKTPRVLGVGATRKTEKRRGRQPESANRQPSDRRACEQLLGGAGLGRRIVACDLMPRVSWSVSLGTILACYPEACM